MYAFFRNCAYLRRKGSGGCKRLLHIRKAGRHYNQLISGYEFGFLRFVSAYVSYKLRYAKYIEEI